MAEVTYQPIFKPFVRSKVVVDNATSRSGQART